MPLTEGYRAGEYILSESNGNRSRETITIASGQAAVLQPGTVLGKITASGKYTPYADGAVDGSEVAAAILYDRVDAIAADKNAVITARDAEVSEAILTGADAPGLTDLSALGIISR